MTKKITIKQSNNLNMASYALSPLSMDVLHVFLSHIKKEDTNFKFLCMDLKGLDKLLGKRVNWRCLEDVASELTTKPIKIQLGENRILRSTWCSSVELDFNKNIIEFEISLKLRDCLLQIPSNFVLTDLTVMSKLKGFYAKRFYLFLSQFSSTGYFKISLEDLRDKFELGDKYTSYADLRKRVLDTAKRNINELLNINLEYKVIKNGKSVVALEFTFNKVKYQKQKKDNKSLSNIESWLNKDEIIDTEIA